MINANVLTSLANATTERYRAYLLALTGALNVAIDGNQATSAATRITFDESSRALAESFYRDEIAKIQGVTTGLVDRAVAVALERARATEDKEKRALLDRQVQENLRLLATNLEAQINRDRMEAVRTLTRMVLEADALMGQGMSRAGALIRVREKYKSATRFGYTDRIGRHWPVERYIQLTVRGHYLTIYNESLLYALTWYGINIARAQYLDPSRASVVFVIVGEPEGVASYSSIKDEIFHPNSTAVAAP